MTDKTQLLFQHENGTLITKGQLEDIIASAVNKTIGHKCRFPISSTQAKEMSHLFGMYSDIGTGDLSMGIEESRKNHAYIQKIRAKSDKFSTYVFMIIIAGVTGGFLKAAWEGMKSLAITK